jgi:hypothetical protein
MGCYNWAIRMESKKKLNTLYIYTDQSTQIIMISTISC